MSIAAALQPAAGWSSQPAASWSSQLAAGLQPAAGWTSQPAVFLDCFGTSCIAMTAIGSAVPIGSGWAAQPRRRKSGTRCPSAQHEFVCRPPHGKRRRDGAAAAHAGARLDGDFLLGKQKNDHTPEGRKKHQCNRRHIGNEWILRLRL